MVVAIETAQHGKPKVYGFYKGFKVVPELLKTRKDKESPWSDVIDESVKLLKCHRLISVRLG